MKKLKSLILIIILTNIFIIACGDSKKKDKPSEPLNPVCNPDHPDDPQPEPIPDPEPTPEPEPEPVPDPEPVPEPEPEPIIKANVTFFGDMATPERIEKYKRAICVFQGVVSMEEFKDRVLNYDSDFTDGKFYNTSKTNEQVYQHILDGNERLQPEKDNEVDVEVQFYYQDSTVIGYTNGSTRRIFVNTKYFDRYTPRSVAGNLMHEWLHKLGYGHSVESTPQRPHSVPYAVGYMVTSLGRDIERECP